MTGLLLAALLGVSFQPGIIDRVEGDWAVVEWPDGSIGDVPVALFERPPRETQAVRLWLLAHPRGPWRRVGDVLRLGSGEPPFDFTIPAPTGAQSDRRYLVVLTVPPPDPGVAADVQRERVVAGGSQPPTPPTRRR
jgi:hypothetical protein